MVAVVINMGRAIMGKRSCTTNLVTGEEVAAGAETAMLWLLQCVMSALRLELRKGAFLPLTLVPSGSPHFKGVEDSHPLRDGGRKKLWPQKRQTMAAWTLLTLTLHCAKD
jgi:hypothetical protein